MWHLQQLFLAPCHRISTHTPVRVWLNSFLTFATSSNISTHTPVRVWHISFQNKIQAINFNSHTREGVTRQSNRLLIYGSNFNSHTREGVTLRFIKLYLIHNISTHTPVRVWPPDLAAAALISLFQLTHPWGCDSSHSSSSSASSRFQLTHPWGCDFFYSTYHICFCISTHTPVRVWPKVTISKPMLSISTHTPVRVWHSQRWIIEW